MSSHQDSPKVPEGAVEALAEMRWDEGRNPDADSPRWDELVGCEDMKRRCCDEARGDLKELAPFLFSALLSDEVVEAMVQSHEITFASALMTSVESQRLQIKLALQAAIEQVGGAK